ncbi:MAG: hypothetical protein A2Z88_03355 [Omnitrophica WOR_2 bacterium GWA2_47_8]|nr:MAG: hypothetical protein A2Z88_03355 [Omnitrophica WOR_2 bacterium GWA2_47_8]
MSVPVSIIVPAYNCSKTIKETLRALVEQPDHPLEIIVVDDGSTDTTSEIIKAFPQVKYIYQNNAGPASARNRGAKESKGEFLFFTDSDCIPEENWVSKALENFKTPDIAVVAGSYSIANESELLANCIHQEIRYRHQKLMPKFPKSFGSYNFCVRRKVFEKVGGFDQNYRFASGEDNDLSYKITKAGYRIFFDPSLIVKHFHTSVLEKYLREQYRHGFWRMKMYLDHPSMMGGDDYTFWKDSAEVLLCYALAGFLVVLPFRIVLFEKLSILALILLILINAYFAFLMMPTLTQKLYFAFVMFLRTFVRSAGFIHGLSLILKGRTNTSTLHPEE